MQLNGDWPDALEEAQRARRRFLETRNEGRVGLALYREAELQRLLGEFEVAEDVYREASRYGWEPQPGLAQLRLAQGRVDVAQSAIRRVLDETTEPLKRAGLLPAYVEIMLIAGEVEAAGRASLELEQLADRYESAMLDGMVAHARGAVLLAEGDAPLRWLRFAALSTYGASSRRRTRSRERANWSGSRSERSATTTLQRSSWMPHCRLRAARAGPDFERVAALLVPARRPHGLTTRELDVLRLVASGKSNKQIAAELVISEHTVARHVQNIFAKLDVSSRTAAASFAFKHELL